MLPFLGWTLRRRLISGPCCCAPCMEVGMPLGKKCQFSLELRGTSARNFLCCLEGSRSWPPSSRREKRVQNYPQAHSIGSREYGLGAALGNQASFQMTSHQCPWAWQDSAREADACAGGADLLILRADSSATPSPRDVLWEEGERVAYGQHKGLGVVAESPYQLFLLVPRAQVLGSPFVLWGRDGERVGVMVRVGVRSHIVRWRQYRASPQFWNISNPDFLSSSFLHSPPLQFFQVIFTFPSISSICFIPPGKDARPCLQTERCAEGIERQAGHEGQVWL